MQYVFKMNMFELGSFNLKEAVVETVEGMRACQDYGRVFGEKLGALLTPETIRLPSILVKLCMRM